MFIKIGDNYSIQRQIADVDAVSIELSRDNGVTWEVLENEVTINHYKSGDQEVYDPLLYNWTVTGPVATQCLLRISDTSDPANIFDLSSAPFEIRNSVPRGTLYKIDITVKSAQVSENDANFPYQYDLSSAMPTVKSQISGSNNICVQDPTTGLLCPKVIKYNLSSNKLLLYFNGSKSTSANKIFYVCIGLGLNVPDSVEALVLAGYQNFFDFNEFVNGTTTEDVVGGKTANLNGVTLANQGKFGNCARVPAGVYNTIQTGQNITLPATEISIEILYNPVASNTYNYLFQIGNLFITPYQNWAAYVSSDGVTSALSGISGAYDTWHYLVLVRRADGTVDLYTDNVKRVNNVALGQPTEKNAPLTICNRTGYWNEFNSYMDMFTILTTPKSASFFSDRYKMLFDTANFSAISDPVKVGSGARRGFSMGFFS